jgi:hypothetical protein
MDVFARMPSALLLQRFTLWDLWHRNCIHLRRNRSPGPAFRQIGTGPRHRIVIPSEALFSGAEEPALSFALCQGTTGEPTQCVGRVS